MNTASHSQSMFFFFMETRRDEATRRPGSRMTSH